MDHSFFFAIIQTAASFFQFVWSTISQDIWLPMHQMNDLIASYFLGAMFAAVTILLFWIGPFVSLRLLALLFAVVIVIEAFDLVLAIVSLIKRIPGVP